MAHQIFKDGISLAAVTVIMAVAAQGADASTLVSSTFSSSTEGWVYGDLSDTGSQPDDVVWDSSTGTITSADPTQGINNGFVAPSKFLGNQSAALGGTLSFQLSDTSNDGVDYSPLSLISGSTVIYANPQGIPSTDTNILTTYSVRLTDSNFYEGDPDNPAAGTPVAAGTVAAVLSNLSQVSVDLDWHTGSDFDRLDNVVLASAVPEPSTWFFLMLGVGGLGLMLRRARTKLKLALPELCL